MANPPVRSNPVGTVYRRAVCRTPGRGAAVTLSRSAERTAELLRTLAHAGRLRIVCALLDGELPANRLARRARIAAPALSQQATILEGAGLITRRRVGRIVMYGLSTARTRARILLLNRLIPDERRAAPRRRPASHPSRITGVGR
jgi:ArsR family transcriptional regulator